MTTPPPRNELQFRLRTLLLGMALAAVVLAIAAPFVRSLNPAARWFLLRWVTLYFLVALGCYVVAGMRRGRANLRAGRRLCADANTGTRTRVVLFVVVLFQSALFFGLTLGHTLDLDSSSTPGLPGGSPVSRMLPFYLNAFTTFVMLIGQAVTIAGLHRLHLCENGVLWRTRFYPWERFNSWSWNKYQENVATLRGKGQSFPFKTTPADHHRVEEILNKYITSQQPEANPTAPPPDLQEAER